MHLTKQIKTLQNYTIANWGVSQKVAKKVEKGEILMSSHIAGYAVVVKNPAADIIIGESLTQDYAELGYVEEGYVQNISQTIELEWVTDAGSLGVIPEAVSYNKTLETRSDTDVEYTLISGKLPDGLLFNSSGDIFGFPTLVSKDVTSTFVIRASDETGKVIDRTFSLTVQGQKPPEFITPAGRIGTFYYGSKVDLTVNYLDTDPEETLTVSLIGGRLPTGLSLDSVGNITGFIQPVSLPSEEAGYDITAFDKFEFDFNNNSITRNYSFTVEVSDGKQSDVRTFELFVQSINEIDELPKTPPVLTTVDTDLGTVRADNYYAFKFDAVDFDGDPIKFTLDGVIPNGLEFDTATGWLYGYLPNQGAVEHDYSFAVGVTNQTSSFYKIVLDSNIDPSIENGYYVSQDDVTISGESPAGVIVGILESNIIIIQKLSTTDFVENQNLKIREVNGGTIIDSVSVSSSENYFVVPHIYDEVEERYVQNISQTPDMAVTQDYAELGYVEEGYVQNIS